MNSKTFFVHVKPKARKNEIVALDETHFEISVKEPAEHDRANIAVLETLGNYLGISFYSLRLVSGKTSRNKIIEIRTAKGFLLIELLIVMAIIAILAGAYYFAGGHGTVSTGQRAIQEARDIKNTAEKQSAEQAKSIEGSSQETPPVHKKRSGVPTLVGAPLLF